VNYLALFGLVFGINLLPAFGPPTWAVLVFARLHWSLNPVALVVLGGIAACSGRYLLALGAKRFKKYLPKRMTENLEAAKDVLEGRKTSILALFGLFVISPLPSAQLFLAAGLLDMPLIPITIAFFIGRTVSYSIYVGAASLASARLGDVVGNAFGSWWSITIQILFLALVCILPFINWKRYLKKPATA